MPSEIQPVPEPPKGPLFKYVIFAGVAILIIIVGLIILGSYYQEPQKEVVGEDTSTWLTYRNDKLGFEFKYEPFLKEDDHAPAKDGDTLVTCLNDPTKEETTGNLCFELKNGSPWDVIGKLYEDEYAWLEVGGRKAYKLMPGSGRCLLEEYLIPLTVNRYLALKYKPCEGDKFLKWINTWGLVSSLKFLDTQSSWEVFRSEKFGIEMEVPTRTVFSEYGYFTGEDTPEEFEEKYGGGAFTPMGIDGPACDLGFWLSPNEGGSRAGIEKKVLNGREFLVTFSEKEYNYQPNLGKGYNYQYDTGSLSFAYDFSINCEKDLPVLEHMLSTLTITAKYPSTTWKTYRNDQHSFEVKVPSDWVVSEAEGGSLVKFDMPEMTMVEIYLKVSPKSRNASGAPAWVHPEGIKIFNGLTFSKYTEGNSQCGTTMYEISHNGQVYEFGTCPWPGRLEDLISTLKFTK